jgi:VIT1/CCC1 family predicted Fe2+/Mn2+ transporter
MVHFIRKTAAAVAPDNGHVIATNARLNSLRAAVLGANDGIVSVSSIILGVAGATNSRVAVFAAGLAGLVAGALSMAVGEYVSVSSQRDTEREYITVEREHLEQHPEEELKELTETYETKGLSPATARKVAEELTDHDAVKAHLNAEFNIDEGDLSSPVAAAISSLLAFTVGGFVPLATVLLMNQNELIVATIVAALIALIITGYLSAAAGRAPKPRAIVRVVFGGLVAMAVTYSIGRLFGQAVG